MSVNKNVHTHTHCRQMHTLWIFWPWNYTASELERPVVMVVPGELKVGTLWLEMPEMQTVGTKKESHRLIKLKDSSSGVS